MDSSFDSLFYLAIAILFGLAALSQNLIVAVLVSVLLSIVIVFKLIYDWDPLNRVKREVPRVRESVSALTPEFYQHASITIREQIKLTLLEHICRLTKIALGVRTNLNTTMLDRQIRARKALPELVNLLQEAHAKYGEFSGAAAPGIETLNTLKNLVTHGTDPA